MEKGSGNGDAETTLLREKEDIWRAGRRGEADESTSSLVSSMALATENGLYQLMFLNKDIGELIRHPERV